MNVTRKLLVQRVSQSIGHSEKETGQILVSILELISSSFVVGDAVKLTKFGTFQVHHSPARIARNPKTSEPAMVKAHKRIVFKASQQLKNRINTQMASSRSQSNPCDEGIR